MKPQHLNPEEAVMASLDLQSKLSVAMHHQTFRLSYEGYDEPVQDLWQSLEKQGIPREKFLAPENGETIIIKV
jgi:L-ascorbate metabolism protein UlaG (beta-lactamase superfamily)